MEFQISKGRIQTSGCAALSSAVGSIGGSIYVVAKRVKLKAHVQSASTASKNFVLSSLILAETIQFSPHCVSFSGEALPRG